MKILLPVFVLFLSCGCFFSCQSNSQKKLSLSEQAAIKLKGSIKEDSGIDHLEEFHTTYEGKCGGYFSLDEIRMKDKYCLFTTDMNSHGYIMVDEKKIELDLIYNKQQSAYHRLLKFEGKNITVELEIIRKTKLQDHWVQYEGSLKFDGGDYRDVFQIIGVARC